MLIEVQQKILVFIFAKQFNKSNHSREINVDDLEKEFNYLTPSEIQNNLFDIDADHLLESVQDEAGEYLKVWLNLSGRKQALKYQKTIEPNKLNFKKQIVAILHADFKGFSEIKDGNLRQHLAKFNKMVELALLNEENCFLHKTGGDDFLICSYSCVVLSEIALKLRDLVKHENWVRHKFPQNMLIRIGLHYGEVDLQFEGDKIVDVVGTNVDVAARIQATTEPNQVWCSKQFHENISNESLLNIKKVSLGKKELVKNYGKMELYHLVWESEGFVVPQPVIPKLKRKITPEEIHTKVKEAYQIVSLYFQNALKSLEENNPHVKVIFILSEETKLVFKLKNEGSIIAKCKIWFDDKKGWASIAYNDQNLDNENEMNEFLLPSFDGYEILFNPQMGFFYGMPEFELGLSQELAADYLWKRFCKNIQ